MVKLVGFVVVFLILLGCSREVDVVAPVNEKAALAGVVVEPVSLADDYLIRLENYQLVALSTGGFEMVADVSFIPKGKQLEVVLVMFEEEEVANVEVYRRGEPVSWTWVTANRIRCFVPNEIINFRCAYVLLDNE